MLAAGVGGAMIGGGVPYTGVVSIFIVSTVWAAVCYAIYPNDGILPLLITVYMFACVIRVTCTRPCTDIPQSNVQVLSACISASIIGGTSMVFDVILPERMHACVAFAVSMCAGSAIAKVTVPSATHATLDIDAIAIIAWMGGISYDVCPSSPRIYIIVCILLWGILSTVLLRCTDTGILRSIIYPWVISSVHQINTADTDIAKKAW